MIRTLIITWARNALLLALVFADSLIHIYGGAPDSKPQTASLHATILDGAGQCVRPMMLMIALAAIIGLLPAMVSTRIGSQPQQPLAVVTDGDMPMTLLMNRYLMPLLHGFYGHRETLTVAGDLAH